MGRLAQTGALPQWGQYITDGDDSETPADWGSCEAGGRLVEHGCTGRLGDGLTRGGERAGGVNDVVLLNGESPGVDRRELGCERGVGEELGARSVEVDAERELLEPLEYGESEVSDRDT